MKINTEIKKLEELTGLPVVPDLYEGSSDKWITFTYQDEYLDDYADDEAQSEVVELYVHLYTPHTFNYFGLKDTIRDYLMGLKGYSLQRIRSTVVTDNGVKYRQVVFDFKIKKMKG